MSLNFQNLLNPIKKFGILLFTILVWAYVIFGFVLHFIVCFLFCRFFSDPEWINIRLANAYMAFGIHILGFSFKVKGRENIPKEGPFIICSNHQSHFDIVMLSIGIPHKFAFIAKKELFKIPFLGWDLKHQGHVKIDRNNNREAAKQLIMVEKAMVNDKKCFLFFPEGTRSSDGSIGEFKKGPFQLAVKTGTPILPCKIDGTIGILNKKSLLIRPGKVILTIAPIIPAPEVKHKKEERDLTQELMAKTYEVITGLPSLS
ncbi:lysophospholipid acyltransferase family protein [Thermoproteota archaeon]